MKTKVLKLSSQGQITLPKEWRERLKLKKDVQIMAALRETDQGEMILISTKPFDWIEAAGASGKGLWGDVDRYIANERASWDSDLDLV